ncbi:PA14 domain-containing protein [Hydrogenibacillus schlegelii]|nr:PA14 domain-containing protein [Hydrogenibacillus schlegelii]
MNRRGSTTLQGVIVFMTIAVVITVIYQTVQFSRVRTVVQNAAEEAARVYATNYENPNREKIAREAALGLVAANLRTGTFTGTYTVNDVPPGWIQGTLGKKDDRYVLQTVPYEAATESLRAELDRLVGKHVAAKIDTVTDESAKWNTVTAVPNDLNPAPGTGINIIPGQLEFAWYSPVPAAPNNRQEMDRLLERHRDRIKGQGIWKDRPLDFYSYYGSPVLNELRKIPGFEQLPQTDFLMDFWGYLYIPETGTYVFGVDSDDASDVIIDGDVVAAFYGGHGMKGQPVPGPEVHLERGYHPFRVRLNQGPQAFGLRVYWKKPGDQNFTLIEPKYFASAVPETAVKTITIDDRVPVQIAGNSWNTFFLDRSGRLWTVGFNDGLNSRGDHRLFTTNVEPERLFPNDTFRLISAESNISGVAVKTDGTVITWGYVYDDTPYRVMRFNEPHAGIVHVDVGGHNILYLDRNGKLFVTAWNHHGDGAPGYFANYTMAVKVMENVVDAAGGYEASYAVTSDGRAFAWGSALTGQLGIGPVQEDQRTPREIQYFTQNNIKIKSVKAGDHFALFLSADGRVFTTGWNVSGELGLGDRVMRWTPEPVPGLPRIVEASVSKRNVLVRDDSGNAYAWGEIIGSARPVKLSLPGKVKKIWATPAGGFLLLETDELYAFGRTDFAQLGTMSRKPLPAGEIVRVYPFSKAGTYSFLVPLREPEVFLDERESQITDPILDDRLRLAVQFGRNETFHNTVDVDFWAESPGASVKHLEIPLSVEEPTYQPAPLPYPRTTYLGKEATIVDARGKSNGATTRLVDRIDGNGGVRFKLALTPSDLGYLTVYSRNQGGSYFSLYFRPKARTISTAWNGAEPMEIRIDSSDEFYSWMDVELSWERIKTEPDFARYTLTVKTGRKTYNQTFRGIYFNQSFIDYTSHYLDGGMVSYISDLFVKSETELYRKFDRSLDITDLKPGEYTVVLSTRSTIKDETSPVRLAFLPSQSVKKIRYARFSVHDPSISGGYGDPGTPVKMRLSLRNESAFTIQPGELIVEWREGKTVVRKDPLPMGKSIAPGEWLNIAADLPTPEKKGVYDLVIRYDVQDPYTRSTEIVFRPVYVGILPTKPVITAVQEVHQNSRTISTPLVEIRFRETRDQVESEVIYHQPLLWDFGRFFGMGGQGPVRDVVGRSVMRLEKPLFGP